MTDTIQAIETSYAGCRFRSRTEARVAVMLDAAGLPWEYEPEGFETTCGRYLPDFRVTLWPGKTWWLEVKPSNYVADDGDMGRWICLAMESGSTLVAVCGLGIHTIVVGVGGDVYSHAGYPGIFAAGHIAAGKSARFEYGEQG